MIRCFIASCIVLLFATAGWAAPLAAKKPSETVVLTNSPTNGPCSVEQIATLIVADGTEVPFVLGTGKALMITDITWMVEGATSGDTVGIELSAAGADVSIIIVDGEANGRGVARGQTHFNTPVLMLDTLCANPVVMQGTTVPTLDDIRVMGFITTYR